ncbi:MAG: DMT family transporter [Candidatus Diapherotrites archaeon]|nr:DMT family transporter [Candidatus Diapherotrites archaeon]
MENSKGIALVLLTAIISGFSIFLNAFAVKGIEPVLFTALKNSLVAVMLLSLLLLLKNKNLHKILDKRIFGTLVLIGLVGGSIPFALFFIALQSANAALAGFIQKTLFVFATLFAVILLKEKIDWKFLAGAFLLLAGNALLFSPSLAFSVPVILILIATVFWGLENVISKHALEKLDLDGSAIAFGRMFFGALFLLAFLSFTGQISLAATLSIQQIGWIVLTSVLLFGYVFTYYNGLKILPVHKATSVLLLAQPITAILSFAFLGTQIGLVEGAGLLLISIGAFSIAGFSVVSRFLKLRGVQVAGK